MTRRFRYSVLTAALAAGTSVPALAQTGAQVPADATAAGTADANNPATQPAPRDTATPSDAASPGQPLPGDIIVTARRRSENLERVPVAVTVVSADVLAKQNITTESELQFSTPGLQVRTGSSATQVNFAVRGQSFDQFSGTRPGVLPYFNEVQASSSIGGGGGTTAFYDLQSVQLLKGPQGTLFGRTATGGAVLFTTAKPGDDFGGYVAGRAGDYDTQQAEGAINLPVVADTLLTRFSGFFGHNRGYQKNLTDGSHPGTQTRYGLRGSATFKSGGFTNDLVVDYYHTNGSSVTAALYSVDPAGTAAFLFSPNVDALFGPGTYARYVAAKRDPDIDPAGLSSYFNNRQQPRGPYTIASDSANVYRARNLIVTDASTLALTDEVRLRNIFGYSRFKSILANDSDGSPYGIAGSSYYNIFAAPTGYQQSGPFYNQNGVFKQISDELQLQGSTAALDYTVGFFYSNERSTVLRPSEFTDIVRLLGAGAVTVSNDRKENRTLAGYAQGTYRLEDLTGITGLAITLGGRYTSERARAITLPLDSVYGLAVANPAIYSNDQRRTIGNFSWNVGLQDQVNPDLLLYVASRRAYKDGGFNSDEAPQNGFAETGGNSYRTETVTDAELGAKYQSHGTPVPLRLNLALFHNWVRDSQRTAFATVAGNPAAITVNVPRAKVYGVELDGAVDPAPWLSVGGSVNYIHARFTSQIAAIQGGTARFATYPDTPRWSGTVYGEITAPVSGSLDASLRGDVYAQEGVFYSASGQANPSAHLPGYALVNLRAGLGDKDAGWSVAALVKNVFDKTFYTGGIPLGQLLGFNTAIPGAPRQFTIEARLKF